MSFMNNTWSDYGLNAKESWQNVTGCCALSYPLFYPKINPEKYYSLD